MLAFPLYSIALYGQPASSYTSPCCNISINISSPSFHACSFAARLFIGVDEVIGWSYHSALQLGILCYDFYSYTFSSILWTSQRPLMKMHMEAVSLLRSHLICFHLEMMHIGCKCLIVLLLDLHRM